MEIHQALYFIIIYCILCFNPFIHIFFSNSLFGYNGVFTVGRNGTMVDFSNYEFNCDLSLILNRVLRPNILRIMIEFCDFDTISRTSNDI